MSQEFKIFTANSFPPKRRRARIEKLDYDEGYSCRNCLYRTKNGRQICPSNPMVEYYLDGHFIFCDHHETDGNA